MKKNGLALLSIGSIMMSLDVLAGTLLPISTGLADFMKGFGVVLMIAAIFQMGHRHRATRW